MPHLNRHLRKGLKLLAWVAGVMALLFALQVTVLAFPQILVRNKVQAGTVTLYYDQGSVPEMQELAQRAADRMRGSPLFKPSRNDRVFYIANQSLYQTLARLSLVPPLAQGYNLSIFGNSYISPTRIARLREAHGAPKYSIWEGDPVHTIAHEIAHQMLVDTIGRGTMRRLPDWKREGIVEYLANAGATRQDTLRTLAYRIGELQTSPHWRGRWDWDRRHYEAGLLIEYLVTIEGRSLEDCIVDAVTAESSKAAMHAWYATQKSVM